VVAYIINPVFAVDFMKPHEHKKAINFKKLGITSVIMVVIAAVGYASGNVGFGNFAIFMLLVYLVYRFILKRAIEKFQHSIWPRFQNFYARFLTLVLKETKNNFCWNACASCCINWCHNGTKSKSGFLPEG